MQKLLEQNIERKLPEVGEERTHIIIIKGNFSERVAKIVCLLLFR